MLKKLRTTLGPLFLMAACPCFAILMWYTNTHLQGSFSSLYQLFLKEGFFRTLYNIWRPVFWGSSVAWLIIATFTGTQFLLIKCLPGFVFLGPITPAGNIPRYKANGVLAFVITLLLFISTSFYAGWFSPTIIYDHFGEIIGALNIFSLILCLFLYLKGRFFPCSSDSGTTKNIVFDYYWGTELYPMLGNINLKMFINCRLGMMSWGVILLSYAAKQQVLYGLSNTLVISIVLQLVYITKFFIWETGYLASLDIMHDRAGFYICWGCLVWVPCVYTSPAMYLVLHPYQLSISAAFIILTLGLSAVAINYWADRQRQITRKTLGQAKIWGKMPRVTLANYYTEQGELKQNLLLSSGWWGVARHFHYVPEILAALAWSVPALFNHFSPYFYVCFLTILLIDRAFRDDERCAKKYGQFWQDYCKLVPYKIIPFVL